MELNYYSHFPWASNPDFSRGGNYNDTTTSGLFNFGAPNGNTNSNHSFRPVLATLWYNKFSCLLKQFFTENRIGGIKEV